MTRSERGPRRSGRKKGAGGRAEERQNEDVENRGSGEPNLNLSVQLQEIEFFLDSAGRMICPNACHAVEER